MPGCVSEQQERPIGIVDRERDGLAGLVHAVADDVVGVAARLVGRVAEGVDVEAGHVGDALGERALLDPARDLQVVLDAHEGPEPLAHALVRL